MGLSAETREKIRVEQARFPNAARAARRIYSPATTWARLARGFR